MADLQVCYFCGSGPDSSLGEYAVVPPDLDPTDDQQLSVALCPKCRGKLTTVMEPVVEAVEAAAGAGGAGSSGGDGAVDAGASADADTGADATTDDESSVGDPTAADSPVEPGGADDPVADAATGSGGGSGDPGTSGGADDEVGVSPPDTGTDDEDEISIDPREDRASGEVGPGGHGEGDPPGGSDAGETSDPVPSPDQTPPHADDELVGRNNAAYNKTLRLLQNREFPVERHEIEQVAANAYQLDPQEVSDAIDSLIQKGLLSQEGAHLRRP